MRKTREAIAQVLNEAVTLHQRGDVATAEKLYRKVIAAKPGHFHATHMLGVLNFQCGRHQEAEKLIKRAMIANPDDETARYNLGIVLQHQKRLPEALESIDRAIALRPDYIEALNNRGVVLQGLKRPAEAVASYDRAIALNPNYPEAHYNRGSALKDIERFNEALDCFDRAIVLQPNFFNAYLDRANTLKALERHEMALAAYDRVVAMRPAFAEAWTSRGTVSLKLKRIDAAAADYERALGINPELPEAWLGHGNVCVEHRRFDDALAAYERALAREPNIAEAWLGRGHVYLAIKRYGEAISSFNRALEIKSDLADAWHGRGQAFFFSRQYDEAFNAFDKAFLLKPDLLGLEGMRLFAKMNACDWRNFEDDCGHLVSSIEHEKNNAPPFSVLAITNSPSVQLTGATLVAKSLPLLRKPFWQGEVYAHDRIRVAYVSADFREHPVGYLSEDMFACHDKSRFEVTAFSLGADDNSELRKRLSGRFEHFIDATSYSDEEIASEIKKLEIDLLVDLNGYTTDCRTGIFTLRPAPVQVSFLGYPGTMGAEFIDYLVADRHVVPEANQAYYTEKLVYLPDSYLPTSHKANEGRYSVSNSQLTRVDVGLPDTGFVFCCFNNDHKITPEVYDCWMKILQQVAGSVLWLRGWNDLSAANLRYEAVARGIDPDRLVFARYLPTTDHLARHRFADLFLDTFPYNAHTTATDALWMGLPVLTRMGETFTSRVAGSLLNSIGLPDLVTRTSEQYVNLAVELASNPAKLAALKERLQQNRLTMPLFDTPLLTRNLETAYEAMWKRYQSGLSPDHILVSQ